MTPWTWSAPPPRSSRCGPTATAPPSGLRWAAEATYEGSVRFSEQQLEEPSTIEPVFDALTRWIASTLISLADLPFTFLPAGEDDA